MSVVVDVLADICDDRTDRGKQYVATDELALSLIVTA